MYINLALPVIPLLLYLRDFRSPTQHQEKLVNAIHT